MKKLLFIVFIININWSLSQNIFKSEIGEYYSLSGKEEKRIIEKYLKENELLKKYECFYKINNEPINLYINCMVVDNQDNKWFGTYNGLYKFDDDNWTHYTPSNSQLSFLNITAINIDKEGKLWIASSKMLEEGDCKTFLKSSLNSFDGKNWDTYSSNNSKIMEDLPIKSIKIDINGEKWVLQSNSVCMFDDSNWKIYSDISAYSMTIDNKGNKWFGGDGSIMKFDNLNWKTITTPFMNKFIYTDIISDLTGNIWALDNECVRYGRENLQGTGQNAGRLAKYDGNKWINYEIQNCDNQNASLSSYGKFLTSLAVDSKNNIWFGSNDDCYFGKIQNEEGNIIFKFLPIYYKSSENPDIKTDEEYRCDQTHKNYISPLNYKPKVYIDKNQNLWTYSYKGAISYKISEPFLALKTDTTVNKNLVYDKNQSFPNIKIFDLKFIDNNQILEGNEKSKITFSLVNLGKGDARNISVKIKNNSNVLGINYSLPSTILRIKPNDTSIIVIPLEGNLELLSGLANLKIMFEEANGFPPDPIEVTIATKEYTKPNIKIVDYTFTTENGVIKQAVPINLKTIIQNTGQGDANDISIKFKWPSINVAPISESDFKISELKAGESKEINFEFMVNKLYSSTSVPIKIEVDEKFHKFFENKEVFTTLNSASNITSIKVESKYQEKKIDINEVSLTSDVDKNIPTNSNVFPNKYALIIGNEDYSSRQSGLNSESNVKFAINDAKSFSEYATNVLGVPKDNCFLILNATSAEMNQKINIITQILSKLVDSSEFIFYYAGHGYPDEITKSPYLVPVDVSATNLQSAINVTELYKKFSNTKAKRITVFLDACFSGGGRDQGLLATRGVRIVKDEVLNSKMVVFSATNNEQSALPYSEKQHGIFTYFLLKKLQETKGDLSYIELENYLKQTVSIQSLKINNTNQDPQVNVSPDIINIWSNWRF